MITFFTVMLIVTCFLCLYRVLVGPTPPDRTVAIDVIGIVVVGFCALVTLTTRQSFWMDIALSWALLSFIGTMALAKFLEGRGFDE